MLRMVVWLTALVQLLPAVTAFYPYHQPTPGDSNVKRSATHPHQRSYDLNEGGLTLGLQRLPVRRDNAFTILAASTPSQKNSLGVDQDGTDFSYFCTFQFGTSSKKYYLLLDSAASNTWVMSADCTTAACNAHNTLGSRDSASLKGSQTPFSVVYGTGSVSGNTATDTLKTAGFSVPLTFGLATTVSEDFLPYPMDGILGFGRVDQIADNSKGVRAPTLMDVLVSQKVISSKVFGLHLWRTSDGGANDGAINFGAPDTSRYDGSLNYISAIKNTLGFWEVPIDNAGVNGKLAGLSGRTAIIDSGTSFILMPQPDAEKLIGSIPGFTQMGESFTIPCNTRLSIQVVFGGKSYDISWQDYVGKVSSGNDCVSNIIGRQTFGANQWLVGDVFLKNVYTVFDYDNVKVGFGVKAAGLTTSSNVATTALAATVTSGNSSGIGLIPAAASSSSSSSRSASSTSSGSAGASATGTTSAATGSAAYGGRVVAVLATLILFVF